MSEDEEKKLVFGMLHSLKGLCEKFSLSGQTYVAPTDGWHLTLGEKTNTTIELKT